VKRQSALFRHPCSGFEKDSNLNNPSKPKWLILPFWIQKKRDIAEQAPHFAAKMFVKKNVQD